MQHSSYIDGFVLPVPKQYLSIYQQAAEKIATIWQEYGATSYQEFVGDDLHLSGTISFTTFVQPKEDEVIVFGWVEFPSKEIRDLANSKVPQDARMAEIIAPLVQPDAPIFDASRMVYGGFNSLVISSA